MNFGAIARKTLQILAPALAAMSLIASPQLALAQTAQVPAPVVAEVPVDAPLAGEVAVGEAAVEPAAFEYYGPEMIKGQPEPGGYDFQPQFTDDGDYAYKMHTYLLMPIITAISLFVLGLLLWVVVRYNRRRNAVPSKTSHNTLIEVIWTVIPVIILVVIAVPSITLLASQYKAPPEDAITIKASGYQWNWVYYLSGQWRL